MEDWKAEARLGVIAGPEREAIWLKALHNNCPITEESSNTNAIVSLLRANFLSCVGVVTSSGSSNIGEEVGNAIRNRVLSFYFPQSLLEYYTELEVFRALVLHRVPKTYQVLTSTRMNALSDECLALVFSDFFFSLLTTPSLLRFLDVFFIEGHRGLLRFGLGLIVASKAAIKANAFSSGEEFWRDASSTVSLEALLKHSFDTGRNAFQKVIRPTGISRSNLQSLRNNCIAKVRNRSLNIPTAISTCQKQQQQQQHQQQQQLDLNKAIESVMRKSQILDRKQTEALVSFLPLAVQVQAEQLEPAYSLQRDGCSIRTMLERTKGKSPCILLCKPANKEGYIVGAYIAKSLGPSNTQIKGDGTTFVFRLSSSSDEQDVTRSSEKCSWLRNDRLLVHQFAIITNAYMAFGYHHEHGTNAIRIDEDFSLLHVGPSDTFGNSEPLLPREADSDSLLNSFRIEGFEVFAR